MAFARSRWQIIYLLPVLFLAAFYVYPLLTIFDISLRPDGALDLSSFAQLFSSNYYIGTLLFTFWQALLSTALTIALALPCAYVIRALSLQRPSPSCFLSPFCHSCCRRSSWRWPLCRC